MANSPQARKRAKQNVTRNALKSSQRSMTRTYLKKINAAVESKDKELAQATYKQTVSILDNMANKGVIHKNKAARHKQRLNAKIKAMA